MVSKFICSAFAAAALLATAAPAAALTWTAGDLNTTETLNFNGFIGSPANQTVIPGLTAQISYKLTGILNGGQTWTFAYDVANTSSAPTTASRLQSFGFDLSANPLQTSDVTGAYFSEGYGVNIPNGLGTADICFKAFANGTCTGNGQGLLIGQNGSGTLTLNFAQVQNSLEMSNLFVRWQSISPSTISGSATGIPVSAVPEPASWALMIAGFGMAGAALRRRRAELVA